MRLYFRWQHHDQRCRQSPHRTKPYRATTQSLDMAQTHQLLLNEYKTVKTREMYASYGPFFNA